jgi:hypothetical protein
MVLGPLKDFLQEVPDRFFVIDNKNGGHSEKSTYEIFRSYLCWILLSREKLKEGESCMMLAKVRSACCSPAERMK